MKYVLEPEAVRYVRAQWGRKARVWYMEAPKLRVVVRYAPQVGEGEECPF